MNDLGLSEYCVDIRTFDLQALNDLFMRMIDNREAIRKAMSERLKSYRGDLAAQFDVLFPRESSNAHQ
jgi:polysaccharide pyruvyl transferase WcaK-like protein